MTSADVAPVAALEARAFPQPWHEDTFRRLVEEPTVVMQVIEDRGRVVGYGILMAVLDQGEIANLAVDPQHRSRGMGRSLLDGLLAAGRDRGVERVFLEVRPSNTPARRLYASRGFTEVGRRRDYYDSPREDALVLTLDLTTTTDDGADS